MSIFREYRIWVFHSSKDLIISIKWNFLLFGGLTVFDIKVYSLYLSVHFSVVFVMEVLIVLMIQQCPLNRGDCNSEGLLIREKDPFAI